MAPAFVSNSLTSRAPKSGSSAAYPQAQLRFNKGGRYRGSVPRSQTGGVSLISGYGVLALGFMMIMYALEQRGRLFILAFALGCLLSSVYGFLSGAWPFGVVEAIWCVVAVQRFRTSPVRVG